MRLSTVYLEVGDAGTVHACRDFYSTMLGLDVSSEEPDHSVWLDAEGVMVGFHVGDPPGRPGAVNLSFTVNDADAEGARLTAAGVVVHGPAWDAPWGGRVVTTNDPAGHTVWLSGPRRG